MNNVLETRTHCPTCYQLLPHTDVYNEVYRVKSIKKIGRPPKVIYTENGPKIKNTDGYIYFN